MHLLVGSKNITKIYHYLNKNDDCIFLSQKVIKFYSYTYCLFGVYKLKLNILLRNTHINCRISYV